MRFVTGSATDVGKRRTGNEDSFLVDDDHHLYAVADGMGGHNAGEVASATAIEALRATFSVPPAIAEAVRNANSAVLDKAATDAGYENMGTTLTALAVDGDRATIGHVGDSRAYLLRNGELTRITEDHKWVEQLVREGRISAEEAEVHPQRSIVTRALGIDPDVDVDTEAVDLTAGDRLMLCSDGLSDMLRENEIASVLRRESEPQRAAQSLVDAAYSAGGDDNITVVVIDVVGDDGAALAASEALANDAVPNEPTGHWETPPALLAQQEEERLARTHARRRRLTRIVAFALPIVILVAAAVAALGWYARGTYYVGARRDRVALYRGIPGGVLGWQPTVERTYAVKASELEPVDAQDVRAGKKFSSRHRAIQYVHRLEAEIKLLHIEGDLPSTSSTTAPPGPPVNTNPTSP